MTGHAWRRWCAAATALFAAACASSPAAGPSSTAPPSGAFTPDAMLKVCPQITATNAPTIDADRNIIGYKPYVRVRQTVLAVSPTNGGCLTSGFGPRGGGAHKGIDIQTRPASMVHAAASGQVREAGFRADYGNYVVLDHGGGVFTRYAHLEALEGGVTQGANLSFGARLGKMGATAAYVIPIHLHYEVLTGDYDTPQQSFGLIPVNVFDQAFVG